MAGWRRSSFCNFGNCVEVKALTGGDVLVRNSATPDGRCLVFTAAEWAAFVAGVKAGKFDTPGSPDVAANPGKPVCVSTRYGPGCGHPAADHDGDQTRECCCCTGRHNDPEHVKDCLHCSIMHAKRWAGGGATNGEVEKHIPEALRPAFWRQAVERYATEKGISTE